MMPVPISAGMNIVVSRSVVIVTAIRHVPPWMIIVVGRIVPVAVATTAIPSALIPWLLPIVAMPAVSPSYVNVHTTPPVMESLSIGRLGVHTCKA